ncbi:MFS transporter small subunit [Streptomyces mirabilis]|uniref:MFS transporter small subunit n=1 Tax=Streptomyces mirabilis TaxID=68239 RepID=UPI003BEF333C
MTTPSSPSSPPDLPHSRLRSSGGTPIPLIAFAWLWVGAPLCYGLYELVLKAKQLFAG